MLRQERHIMLFFPGDNLRFLARALESKADSLIHDVEDACAPEHKARGREVVAEAFLSKDYGDKEKAVRINPLSTEWGYQDVVAFTRAGADVLLVPKVRGAASLVQVADIISEVEEAHDLPRGKVKLMALIEHARAVMEVEQIAVVPRVVGLMFGAGDYSSSMRAGRPVSAEEWELYYPRMKVLTAARAVGIDPIDTPYFGIRDLEGLKRSTQISKQMGFQGRAVLHPDHIPVVLGVYDPGPTLEDVERARKIIAAVAEMVAKGRGEDFNADLGQMVGPGSMRQAQRVLQRAKEAGII